MAHEKANLVCDDMCMVEGIPKENIAVLQGVIDTSVPNGVKNENITLPSGFTRKNSAILYFGYDIQNASSPSVVTYKDGYIGTYPFAYIALDKDSTYNDIDITICGNADSKITNAKLYYKIVLLKLDTWSE